MKEFTQIQWENTGLLEEFTKDRKLVATHAFNVVFKWLEEHREEPEQDIPGFTGQYETLPLDVIHKIIKNVDLTDQEILEICNEVHIAFDKFDITEILKHTYSTIDAEAEFVAEFSEKKINQYKNK